MRLILLRHGQTQWNRENRIHGWGNSDLTPSAIRQLKQWIPPTLRNPIVYASDLGRAKQTASIIAEKIGTEFTLDARLRERQFGVLQGRVIDQDRPLAKAWHLYHHRYLSKTGQQFGFECEWDFERRIGDFFSDLNKSFAHLNDNTARADIVIISHGEWIRAAINLLQGRPSWHEGQGITSNKRVNWLSVNYDVSHSLHSNSRC
ncbi:histidine phosphatase family protein [Vibrio rarus]|uniref:histidine phosphatase family protein n=1 Tax=Vibrio rarus TaxID=413403 RepID=UPI0021C43D3B|nr:histidine phosphatase family protein [Vibrio rarus]